MKKRYNRFFRFVHVETTDLVGDVAISVHVSFAVICIILSGARILLVISNEDIGKFSMHPLLQFLQFTPRQERSNLLEDIFYNLFGVIGRKE